METPMINRLGIVLLIIPVLLLPGACGETGKKEHPAGDSPMQPVAAQTGDISLEQKADYTDLYTARGSCKLTSTQLAEALGLEAGRAEEISNYNGLCGYSATHADGLTVRYQIGNEQWPQDIVRDNIRSAMESELFDIRVSESGDTYLSRHPAQGFLLLLNPDYGNPVKISFNYFNPDGPKPTEAQKEAIRQNTYKIANYLINQFQK